MTAYEARRRTKKGLYWSLFGAILGFFMISTVGLGGVFIWAYMFWAFYHGVQIVEPHMEMFFDFGPVRLESSSFLELFYRAHTLRLLKVLLPLIFGYVIGVIGGAIIRQLYLLHKARYV